MEYNNSYICPHCKNEITATDDVKVCPTCGTVSHRRCWEQNNGCANPNCPEHVVPSATPVARCVQCGALMEQGKSFCHNCGYNHATPSIIRCLRCNAELAEHSSFCPNCGHPVGAAVTPLTTAAPMTPPPNYGYNPYQPPAPIAPKKKSKAPVIIAIVAFLVLVIVIATAIASCDGSGGSSYGGRQSDFNDKFSEYADEIWCYISPDGSYMKIDTNPSDIKDRMELTAYYELENINSALGFSSALYSKMGETSALDGRQTESNDKYTVSWKYHPNTGLEVTYEIND